MINKFTGNAVIFLIYLIPFQDLLISFLFVTELPMILLKVLLLLKEIVIILVVGTTVSVRLRVSLGHFLLVVLFLYSSLFLFVSDAGFVGALLGYRTYVLFCFSFVIGGRLAYIESFDEKFIKHVGIVFWLLFGFSFLEYFVLPESIWKYPFPIMEMKREVANISTSNEYYDTGMPVNAFGEHIRRLLGPFDEPLYMAYYTIVLLNFYCVQLFFKKPWLNSRLLLGGIMILLTQTRAIILGLGLSVVGLFFKSLRVSKRFLLLSIVFLFLTAASVMIFSSFFMAFIDSIFTTGGRNIGHLMAYIDGIENLIENPFGRGLGVSSTLSLTGSTNIATENAFINIGLEIGIIGIIIVLFFFLHLFQRYRSYLIKFGESKKTGVYTIVSSSYLLLIQYIFAGLVAPHILTAKIVIPFMILMGWAYEITRIHEGEPKKNLL
jgi:hypothetical protein